MNKKVPTPWERELEREERIGKEKSTEREWREGISPHTRVKDDRKGPK